MESINANLQPLFSLPSSSSPMDSSSSNSSPLQFGQYLKMMNKVNDDKNELEEDLVIMKEQLNKLNDDNKELKEELVKKNEQSNDDKEWLTIVAKLKRKCVDLLDTKIDLESTIDNQNEKLQKLEPLEGMLPFVEGMVPFVAGLSLLKNISQTHDDDDFD